MGSNGAVRPPVYGTSFVARQYTYQQKTAVTIWGKHQTTGTKAELRRTRMRLKLCRMNSAHPSGAPFLSANETIPPGELAHDENDVRVEHDTEERHSQVVHDRREPRKRPVRHEEHVAALEEDVLKTALRRQADQKL